MTPTRDSSPEPPPPSSETSSLFHRVLDHWFAPTANEWPWWRRFIFTFLGSATFILTWLLYVLAADTKDSPDASQAVTLFMTAVALPYTLFFAGITAWKDLSYGPVRLYLSGFLLPYFVWTLIWFMLTRPQPETLL